MTHQLFFYVLLAIMARYCNFSNIKTMNIFFHVTLFVSSEVIRRANWELSKFRKKKHRYLKNVLSDERDGHVEFIYLCNCLVLSCGTLCFLVEIFTFFVFLTFKFKIFNHERIWVAKQLWFNPKTKKKVKITTKK